MTKDSDRIERVTALPKPGDNWSDPEGRARLVESVDCISTDLYTVNYRAEEHGSLESATCELGQSREFEQELIEAVEKLNDEILSATDPDEYAVEFELRFGSAGFAYVLFAGEQIWNSETGDNRRDDAAGNPEPLAACFRREARRVIRNIIAVNIIFAD